MLGLLLTNMVLCAPDEELFLGPMGFLWVIDGLTNAATTILSLLLRFSCGWMFVVLGYYTKILYHRILLSKSSFQVVRRWV